MKMTKEEDFNKYISNLCKIIKSGDPKYLAYVSKEYLKNRRNNQIATVIIENAIQAQSKKEGSVYAIFIDNDNTMNIEAISNISKITNVAEFVKNVNALSEQDVDFGDLTSNELVIQGMKIAEELAKELEGVEMQVESSDNIEDQVAAALQIEQKTDETLNKLAVTGGISATIIATFNSIKSKIALKIEKIRQAINQKKLDKLKNVEEEIQHELPIEENENKV